MEEKIKILYAEDSEEWASMIKQLLNTQGFDVQIAPDGEKALEIFRSTSFDMVLLDIDMPGRNGWELIRELKLEKEGIPVVLYSSGYDSKLLNEAFGLGAEDFLSKTTSPEELANRLLAFHQRAMMQKGKKEILKISEKTFFNPGINVLYTNTKKEILKQNEAKLLHLLYLKINQEANLCYLCEGIWGQRMYNKAKCNALKIHITNLRKLLKADTSIQIINKRWGGYYLLNTSEQSESH